MRVDKKLPVAKAYPSFIDRYIKYLIEIARKFEEGQLNFLEYQALGYKAIRDLETEFKKAYPRTDIGLGGMLLSIWIYQDPLIYKLRGSGLSDTHSDKLEIIGDELVKLLLKRREINTHTNRL